MSRPADHTPGFLTVGQDLARDIAVRSVVGGRVPGSFLVHGPAGSGKAAFVDDLLALLVCSQPLPGVGPCNACRGCRLSRAGGHPDIVRASTESWRAARSGAESIVSATRRWLLEIAGAPVEAERRVAIIDGADRSTEHSQNALLKALEEPSPRHVFVLVAQDAGRLLPTIRSRCQALRVGPSAVSDVAGWLERRYLLPLDQADALARLSGGRTGLAASFAEQPALVTWRRKLQAQLLALVERGRADRFAAVRDVIDEATAVLPLTPSAGPVDGETGPGPEERAAARSPAAVQRAAALAVTEIWLDLARDLLVASVGRADVARSATVLEELPAVAESVGGEALGRFIRTLERIRSGLLENASARLSLEIAMLDWPSARPAATTSSVA